MSPNRPSSRLAAAAFVLATAALAAAGCRDTAAKKHDGGVPEPDTGDAAFDPETGAGFSRPLLLHAFGTCALESARVFRARADALAAATTALAADPSRDNATAARDAFAAAMSAWQIVEAMQFGPAAQSTLPGGQDLRDHVYSWPLVSRCAVEEQIVARGYESAGFPNAAINRRGLDALEYLLHYEGTDTACLASSPIVAGGTWAALSPDELATRKRAYAAAAAADVAARGAALAAAWDPTGGAFLDKLAGAGPGNPVYATAQAALNAVSDAAFYIESAVKDMKVAVPLGLRDCAAATCPEALESRFAALSKANVAANLVGFRKLFEGCGEDFAGPGFDDLLRSVGADATAAAMIEQLAAIDAAMAAVASPDFRPALADAPATVHAVYEALRALTSRLKTEFITILDLELPMGLESDND